MTRINLIPVEDLCDEHLRAEHRELSRIPNVVYRGWRPMVIPAHYTGSTFANPKGGVGHVTFFANKLYFLYRRYQMLRDECHRRGFTGENRWNPDINADTMSLWWGDYDPTEDALALNRSRVQEKTPVKAHMWGKRIYSALQSVIPQDVHAT